MSLDFHCPGCASVLRVPEEAAGKKARCPQCGRTVDVPSGASPGSPFAVPASGNPPPFSAPPPPPFAVGMPAPRLDENPYSAPTQGYTSGSGAPGYIGELRPTIISVGDVFRQSWRIYQGQMVMCIAAILIAGLANLGVNFVANIAVQVGLAVLGREPVVAVALLAVMMLFLMTMQLWVQAGLTMFYLQVARGGRADTGLLFRGGPFLLRLIGVYIIAFVVMFAIWAVLTVPAYAIHENLVAFTLPIVPFCVLALVLIFGQFKNLIIDRDQGVLDSLTTSQIITRGNRLSIFLIMLISFGLALAGILMCFIGMLFTMPLVSVLWSRAYLHMTGQVADDSQTMLYPR